MGNEQSQLAGSSSGAFGFQVLKNTNTQLDIDPWFDFICGINGRKIDDGNARLFQQEVANCAGSAVTLGIWSAKGQRLRDIVIPLKRGAVRGAGPQLGLTLQWCPLGVTEDVWHILDVAPGSPADLAGLLPYGDYILGSPEGMMRGEGALGELVEDHINRPLRLYVYNHEYDITRELTITPNRTWGGEGALGCVLGFGALHRLPPALAEPPNRPGETLFEGRYSDDVGDRAGHGSGAVQQPPPPPQEGGYSGGADNGMSSSQATHIPYTPQWIIPASSSSPGGRYSPAPPAPHAPPPPGPDGPLISSPPPPPHPSSSSATSPPPPGPPPASSHSHHRPHKPSNRRTQISMDEYMLEGEQKSREEDHVPSSRKPGTPGSPGALPPPPMRSAVPPPPRRGGAPTS